MVVNLKVTDQRFGTSDPASGEGARAGPRGSSSSDWSQNVTEERIGSSEPVVVSEHAGLLAPSSCNRTAAGVDHLAPVASNASSEEKQQAYDRLGKKIAELLNFIKSKNNVHHQIRTLAYSIRNAYDQTRREEKGMNASPVTSGLAANTATTQTSPTLLESGPPNVGKIGSSNSRVAAVRGEMTPKTQQVDTPKRKRSTPPSNGARVPKKKKGNKSTSRITEEEEQNSASHSTTTEWQEVRSRKPPKRRSRPTLPDALVIQKKGDLTYAEILSKVKSDPALEELGKMVTRIRRTLAGDLLLQLDKSATEQTARFRSSIETALGNEAEVKTRVHEVEVEIKDLDEVATKEDVCAALIQQIEEARGITEASIKSIRQAYGGTQIAVVSLPAEVAKKAIQVEKIRVGWVVCRIREKMRLTRCFKCWHYGHLSRSCKSAVDRSDHCIKCGAEGHKAKICTSKPRCVLCLEKGDNSNSDHAAGSSKCLVYKEAFQAANRKR